MTQISSPELSADEHDVFFFFFFFFFWGNFYDCKGSNTVKTFLSVLLVVNSQKKEMILTPLSKMPGIQKSKREVTNFIFPCENVGNFPRFIRSHSIPL